MLINRKSLPEHLPWIFAGLALTAGACLWYFGQASAVPWGQRPRGSSTVGFTLGVAGGLICLFEFLLWPRKKLRVWRLGRVTGWMRAHIWLGLLSVPFLVLHSGFYFQNLEATVLLVLFLVVIVSGVWGLAVQQLLPQRLLDDVPAETIYSQIGHLSNLLHDEGRQLIEATCGPAEEEEEPEAAPAVIEGDPFATVHFTVGAVRVIGGLQGKVLQSRPTATEPVRAEALREFFHREAAVYLKRGAESGSRLAVAARARAAFDDVRLLIDPQAHEAAAALENLCDQRRQFDRQARLHRWLHNWLWLHLPLSVVLIILMFVHVWRTLQYWWPS